MRRFMVILVALVGICSSAFAQTFSAQFKSDDIKSFVVKIDFYKDGSCGYTKGNTEYSGTYEVKQNRDIFKKNLTLKLYDEYTKQYFYLNGTIGYSDGRYANYMTIDELGRFSKK